MAEHYKAIRDIVYKVGQLQKQIDATKSTLKEKEKSLGVYSAIKDSEKNAEIVELATYRLAALKEKELLSEINSVKNLTILNLQVNIHKLELEKKKHEEEYSTLSQKLSKDADNILEFKKNEDV